jgi:ABC-type nickel/cobalt efflux system permease component RcnA
MWARITHPNVLMNLLFDSREGLTLMLVVSALAGAAHALTPGHGKSMVAAYLVGQRGTYWQAVLLGIVVTLTHTSAVIAIAILLRLLPIDPNQALALQGLIGGSVIAALGLWLLIRRLQGRADHFHLGGHQHHHGHGHTHPHTHDHGDMEHTHDAGGAIVLTKPKRTGVWEVIMLGIGGGLLPCADAVALLFFAISSGKAPLALPLLLAFSAGLATVLVILGLAVVGAKRVAQLTTPSTGWLETLVRPLPILSAAFVTLVGLWLCYGALNP